jgi:hypothetical protein
MLTLASELDSNQKELAILARSEGNFSARLLAFSAPTNPAGRADLDTG